jgi:hypothetical protein
VQLGRGGLSQVADHQEEATRPLVLIYSESGSHPFSPGFSEAAIRTRLYTGGAWRIRDTAMSADLNHLATFSSCEAASASARRRQMSRPRQASQEAAGSMMAALKRKRAQGIVASPEGAS